MIDVLRRLYSIFGDVVLLAVGFKSKKPINPSWQTVSFADSRKPAYQAELEAAVRRPA